MESLSEEDARRLEEVEQGITAALQKIDESTSPYHVIVERSWM